MKVQLENVKPMDIEKRSFEIITEELGDKKLVPGTELVVKRCIHTSADFDYADNLCFSPEVIEKAMAAIKDGACIVTDTQMAKSGINKRALARYGGEVYCFMSDKDVAEMAKKNGTTRATASMDKAAALNKKLIFAIGNAPTALVRLYELIQEGKLDPELIIGVPVGFVNVVQSKELIMESGAPYIVARDVRRKQYCSLYLQCPALHDRQPERLKTINYLLQKSAGRTEVSCGHRGAGKQQSDGRRVFFQNSKAQSQKSCCFFYRCAVCLTGKRKGKAGSGGSDLNTAVCAKGFSDRGKKLLQLGRIQPFQPPCLSGKMTVPDKLAQGNLFCFGSSLIIIFGFFPVGLRKSRGKYHKAYPDRGRRSWKKNRYKQRHVLPKG